MKIEVVAALVLGASLSACQTTQGNHDQLSREYISNMTVSEPTKNWLNQYLEIRNSKILVISESGQMSYRWHPDGGVISPASMQGKTLADCESNTQEKCRVFAINDSISSSTFD